MSYSAKIIADSVNVHGDRITTFELTYPRFIHSEFMTHRMFSRNTSSSRAIPVRKILERVVNHPATPVFWGKNQSGMKAREELTGFNVWLAKALWMQSRWIAVGVAWALMKLDLHKQLCNRILETWMWVTVICTATNYDHFFALRDHKDAQPEIAWLAQLMSLAYRESTPEYVRAGEWHLPYVTPRERVTHRGMQKTLLALSVARCARVSYLNHDGTSSLQKDETLHDQLATSKHWSPFEHQAKAMTTSTRCGNFRGWRQYRKAFKGEFVDQRRYNALCLPHD